MFYFNLKRLEPISTKLNSYNSNALSREKNTSSEIPVITEILNINNKRTTREKSVKLDIIRKFIFTEHSIKKVVVIAM